MRAVRLNPAGVATGIAMAILLGACGASHALAPDACVPSPELCNGIDDDCDGVVDENPEADDSCGVQVCVEGACASPACVAGQADCDGDPTNGCEADLSSSPSSCGSCGHSCRAGMPCVLGVCGEDRLAISAGDRHTCAVTPMGYVRCWGSNVIHELGDGTTLARGEPIEVSGVENAVDVAVSDFRSCAVLATGDVTCWGGELPPWTAPVADDIDSAVLRPGAGKAVSVAVAGLNGCAVMADGTVECWRSGEDRVASVPVAGIRDAVEIALGASHGCALRATGAVMCWGRNGLGQLGDGTNEDSLVPVAVATLDDAVDVSAANDRTCAVRRGGEVVCWGGSGTGSGPPGSTPYVPRLVPGIDDATTIAVGIAHACAYRRSGQLNCWGDNRQGQSGGRRGHPEPTHVVSGVGDVAALTASKGILTAHTCAMAPDGSVRCWGAGADAQIGDGEARFMSATPVRTDDRGNLARRVSVSGATACVARPSGAVACWGGRGDGEWPAEVRNVGGAVEVSVGGTECSVGSGTAVTCWGTDLTAAPWEIAGLAPAWHVAAGSLHTCALTSDTGGPPFDVFCWGFDDQGQLGDGLLDTTYRESAERVAGVPGAISLAAGHKHTCVVTEAGEVWCWGANNSDQVGAPRSGPVTRPRRVPGVAGAMAVTAGTAHTCALLATGHVMCWGNNGAGQLGVPASERAVLDPVEVPGLDDVRQLVAAGPQIIGPAAPYADVSLFGFIGAATCALRGDGSVWCWGSNQYGLLGDGTREDRAAPRPVDGLTDVIDLGMGTGSACAVTRSGETWCWGWNMRGLLGTNVPVNALQPARVTGLP